MATITQTINVKREYGSGLNFKRQKFVALMEQVLKQEVKTLVVAHKERLCRFGSYLGEWIYNAHRCALVILNSTYKPPHQELMEDFMSIKHCFSDKLYFLRQYENFRKAEFSTDKTDNSVL
ncbi:recombinase family protein [Scytonema hofmannii]|uniref:recombinase family protein n=1 Tax=Scytonema hofmannii TaxID=34078 RepID=UPI00191C8745|nr:recombinase family protein [Scytonema hofmannii]